MSPHHHISIKFELNLFICLQVNYESVVYTIAAILVRPQCVKCGCITSLPKTNEFHVLTHIRRYMYTKVICFHLEGALNSDQPVSVMTASHNSSRMGRKIYFRITFPEVAPYYVIAHNITGAKHGEVLKICGPTTVVNLENLRWWSLTRSMIHFGILPHILVSFNSFYHKMPGYFAIIPLFLLG